MRARVPPRRPCNTVLLARPRPPLPAVDDRPPAEAGGLVALAASTCEEPHRRADAAAEAEHGREGGCCDEREVRSQHRADVGGAAQAVDGASELLALGVELAPHL